MTINPLRSILHHLVVVHKLRQEGVVQILAPQDRGEDTEEITMWFQKRRELRLVDGVATIA